MKKQFTYFFFLVFALCITTSITSKAQVRIQDSLALVDLYNNTNGTSWYNNHNWLTTQPVETWYGISMGVNRSRVASVKLVYNNLTGNIPSSIANITYLKYLNLTQNYLSGSIPPEIGNLAELQYLYLGKLSGSIPPELGKLSALLLLNLRDCDFSGSIPPELGKLSKLQYLDLQNDNLSGSIPPELFNLTELTALNLAKNHLSGNIPPELSNLPKLTTLSLNSNQFSGAIPPELGNIINLYLNNNQLSGKIPKFIPRKSVVLDLSNNKLTGRIPASLGKFKDLTDLRLDHNELKGPIPAEIGNLTKLQYLLLDNNALSKTIPSSFTNLTQLVSLTLSNNQFTFDGMELVAQTFPFAKYTNQANISVHKAKNALSVAAGGSMINNTYKWYKAGAPGHTTTIVGDSVFHPAESGDYFVTVRNKVAIGLILKSDTITYTAPAALNAIAAAGKPAFSNNNFAVYPNPAKDMLHIKTNGYVSFSLLNQAGELLRSENINNAGSINVSGVAAGVYYLRNNNNKTVEKIFIIK